MKISLSIFGMLQSVYVCVSLFLGLDLMQNESHPEGKSGHWKNRQPKKNQLKL